MNASFEDVQAAAIPVLQHRIVLDYQARLEGQTGAAVVAALVAEIPMQNRELPATVETR